MCLLHDRKSDEISLQTMSLGTNGVRKNLHRHAANRTWAYCMTRGVHATFYPVFTTVTVHVRGRCVEGDIQIFVSFEFLA